MITVHAQTLILAARNMKLKGDTYSHKTCLRMARAEVNNKLIGLGKSYTLRRIGDPSMVVMNKPPLPGRRYIAWDFGSRVLVLGAGSHRGSGKVWSNIRMLLALDSMAACGGFGKAQIIAIDEVESVPGDVWERLNSHLKPRTIHLDCTPVDKELLALVGRHENKAIHRGGMSRGEKVRRLKMFGGW